MVEESIDKTVEERFKIFKDELDESQFNSVTFLKEKAKEIMHKDEALAKRILTRVINLKIKNVNAVDNIDDKAQPKNNSVIEFVNFLSSLIKSNPFYFFVILPILAYSFYQNYWATERFDSQAQVIVQQPDGISTMDTSMALLSGLGVNNTGISDTELVKAYIYSNDMLAHLNQTIGLREHYSKDNIDYFSRLHKTDTQEDFIEFYRDHVSVYIDSKSNVVHVNAQGFTPNYAQLLSRNIVERAEWYINSVGHQLAEAQLKFIKGEHHLVERRLQEAQRDLLKFQQRYNLLDPTAEGIAMQQIAYNIEGQISLKEAELNGVKGVMSVNAPQVILLENELRALRQQLENERNKLSQDSEENIPVSEILARYTDLKIKMELALQAYTSSQISLEKSRIEAYRKLKYLVVVESSTLPESNKYPEVFYNISLFAIILSMVFAMFRIILLIFNELK